MIRLAFLRHGETAWNRDGRIQGRADVPLSAAGRAALAGRRLPEPFRGAPAYCSPLRRAVETAALLGIPAPRIEALLIEADWGRYEGRTLAALRREEGEALARAERLGLDFRPPGGESPREIMARLSLWLGTLAAGAAGAGGAIDPTGAAQGAAVAITHKGVIRTALALGYGWDMRGRPPVRLERSGLHVLTLAADGTLAPGCEILPLEET